MFAIAWSKAIGIDIVRLILLPAPASQPVPEASTMILLSSCIVGLFGVRRKWQK